MEKLGKKVYAIPIAICILATCVLSCMFYPMLHMELKGLPMAVTSADQGVKTPAGTINAGDTVVDGILAMNDVEGIPFAWVEVEDQATLDTAMDKGEYYAAIIVPENFTVSNMPGAQPEAITLLVDHAKSPLVSALLGAKLADQLMAAGLPIEMVALHEADFESEFAAGNPVAPAITQQILITALVLMSMVTGLLITRIMLIKRSAPVSDRVKTIVQQVVYSVIIALLVATAIVFIIGCVAGVGMPLVDIFAICFVASWCVVLFVSGFGNIHPGLAILAILAIVSGMLCGILPVEALPQFWQDWIYPWAPQTFMGEALRATLFAGDGILTGYLLTLFVFPAIGLGLTFISAFLPAGKGVKAEAEATAE